MVSALGGWALGPAPVQRAAPRTERAGEFLSLIIFFLAAIVAVAAVFVTSTGETDTARPTFVTVATTTLGSDGAAVSSGTVSEGAISTEAADRAQPRSASEAASQATGRTVPPPERTRTELPVSTTSTDSEIGSVAGLAVATAIEVVEPAASETAATEDPGLFGPTDRIRDYVGLAAAEPLPAMFLYTVEEGDTLASIAAQFGLDEATIHFNNFDLYNPNLLVAGETLRLPTVDGVIYTVQAGDLLSSVAANYAADVEATVAYPGNRLSNANQIQVGQTLVLVGGSASLPVAQVSNGGSVAVAAAWTMPRFRWPLAFDEISDPFGTPRNNRAGYHTGVDFRAAVGTIVGVTAYGQVSFAGWDGSYGYWVEVDHGGGVRSRYAHLSEIWVRTGQWLDAGDFVGTVGNTGNSSGAHLHFEIIMQGTPVDPLGHLE